MSDKYVSEVVIQTTNGATTTIKSIEDIKDIADRVFQMDGYSTFVDIPSNEGIHTIVNMSNVCCIMLRRNEDEEKNAINE